MSHWNGSSATPFRRVRLRSEGLSARPDGTVDGVLIDRRLGNLMEIENVLGARRNGSVSRLQGRSAEVEGLLVDLGTGAVLPLSPTIL